MRLNRTFVGRHCVIMLIMFSIFQASKQSQHSKQRSFIHASSQVVTWGHKTFLVITISKQSVQACIYYLTLFSLHGTLVRTLCWRHEERRRIWSAALGAAAVSCFLSCCLDSTYSVPVSASLKHTKRQFTHRHTVSVVTPHGNIAKKPAGSPPFLLGSYSVYTWQMPGRLALRSVKNPRLVLHTRNMRWTQKCQHTLTQKSNTTQQKQKFVS